MPKKLDCPIGKRFGLVVVIGEADGKIRGRPAWEIKCDCGIVMRRTASELNAGRSRACLKCSNISRRKHGDARNGKQAPEYFVWSGLKKRCLDSTSASWARYGGRGIKVCERWMDYSNFIEDMGRRPGAGWQIDRINNDGNYEPGNCRWATPKQNQRNRSSNRLLTFKGETLCLSEWAERLGMAMETLDSRLRAGHDLELALTEPVRRGQVLDRSKDGRAQGGWRG